MESVAMMNNSSLNLTELEKRHNLPQGLLNAVMMAESSGNPNAVSPKGAQGLFQFMPATAQQYNVDPFNPNQSAEGAARYYSDLLKANNGNLDAAIASYNFGPGNVDAGRPLPQETQDYISKVKSGMGASLEGDSSLPPGFVLDGTDQQEPVSAELPEGFVLDSEQPTQSPLPKSVPVENIAAQQQKPLSFLAEMGQNAAHAVQSAKDLLSGNYEDFGRIVPSPKTQSLGDKLFPEGSSGSPLDALRNLGNTSASDWRDALLEKFHNSFEGKALSTIGGIHPVFNALGTAYSKYAAPAISEYIGVSPENQELAALVGGAVFGLPRASRAVSGTVSSIPQNLSKIVSPEAKATAKAQNIILEAMQEDKISPQSIGTRLARAKETGAPVVALDVAEKNIGGVPISGRNIQALASAAANIPGKGAAIVGETAARKFTQGSRIGGYLDKALKKDGFYEISDDVMANIEKYSNPAREEALSYPKNIDSSEITSLLKRPAGQKALSFAKQMAADAGVKIGFPEEVTNFRPSNILNAEGVPYPIEIKSNKVNGYNTRALDWTKRALDQMINSTEGKNQITGKMTEQGKIWVDIKNKISDTIKEQNPAYKRWMETYGDEASRKEALMSGRAFLTDDPEIVGRQFESFGAPEKQAYMAGVKRALLDTMERAPDNADAVKRVWNEATRSRLAKILDKKQMNELSKSMEIERRMIATDQRNIGGSPTMQRQEYAEKIRQGGVPEKALKALINPKGTAIDFALQELAKPLRKQAKNMDSRTAAELMRILYSNSPQDMAALRTLANKQNIMLPGIRRAQRVAADSALKALPYQNRENRQ